MGLRRMMNQELRPFIYPLEMVKNIVISMGDNSHLYFVRLVISDKNSWYFSRARAL